MNGVSAARGNKAVNLIRYAILTDTTVTVGAGLVMLTTPYLRVNGLLIVSGAVQLG